MRRFTITKSLKMAGFGVLAVLGLTSCEYNDELGRNQLLFGTSPQQMASAANSAWVDLKRQQKVSTDPRYTSRLNRVAPKIIAAAGGNPNEWEYLVFEDKSLNAFALPGGKIGIHTGIMDIMQNDAQLAAVVGHEVAHVNYRHGAERYSQGMLTQLGLAGLSVYGSSQCSNETTSAARQQCQQNAGRWVQALALGATVGVVLPYSRSHELEADSGGVRYMAQAGYDPRQALVFWTNMARAGQSSARPPEFLSTHPATNTRIANLEREVVRLGY